MKSDDFSWLKDALSKEFTNAKITIKQFERGTSSYYLDELGGHSPVKQVGVMLRMDGKAHGIRFPIENIDKGGDIQPINFSNPDKREEIIHGCMVVFLPMKVGNPPHPIYQ